MNSLWKSELFLIWFYTCLYSLIIKKLAIFKLIRTYWPLIILYKWKWYVFDEEHITTKTIFLWL